MTPRATDICCEFLTQRSNKGAIDPQSQKRLCSNTLFDPKIKQDLSIFLTPMNLSPKRYVTAVLRTRMMR